MLQWFRQCVCVCFMLWPCEHDRDLTVVCIFIKLGKHVSHDKRINPIEFGGERSRA